MERNHPARPSGQERACLAHRGPADRILELLYDRGDAFCGLDELAGSARISRQRVPSLLEELRERGHAADFSPGHGVRLVRPVRPDPCLIERGLGTRRIGRSVICFPEVDSTNDVAWDCARSGGRAFPPGADGLVVLAESQRKGRGRFGRRWVCPPGSGVLMSVLLHDPATADRPAGALAHEAMTVAAGLSVAEAIDEVSRVAARLKWPNDVELDGLKVAGVLVEVRGRSADRGMVIGIGINVSASPPSQDVDRPATNLSARVGHPLERVEVVRAVLRRLDEWVDRVSMGRLDELHSAWMARCDMLNSRVNVVSEGRRFTGRVLDVSPLEGLVLMRDDGVQMHLAAETASLV